MKLQDVGAAVALARETRTPVMVNADEMEALGQVATAAEEYFAERARYLVAPEAQMDSIGIDVAAALEQLRTAVEHLRVVST